MIIDLHVLPRQLATMARLVQTALRSAHRIVRVFATKRQVFALPASRGGRDCCVQMVRFTA